MKKIPLILLCSSVFLYACDGSNDTAKKAVDEKVDVSMDTTTETTEAVVEPVTEAASEVEVAASDVEATAGMVAAEEVTTTSEEVAIADADEAISGAAIFKSKCNVCHGSGLAGAPKLGDKAAWAPRIAQGEAVLIKHAIEGFKGETGIMPAKGGATSLSDEEISAVVQYMVLQSK